MTDRDKSESKAKAGYGDMMRKKLEEERKKDKANRTSKKARKAKLRK